MNKFFLYVAFAATSQITRPHDVVREVAQPVSKTSFFNKVVDYFGMGVEARAKAAQVKSESISWPKGRPSGKMRMLPTKAQLDEAKKELGSAEELSKRINNLAPMIQGSIEALADKPIEQLSALKNAESKQAEKDKKAMQKFGTKEELQERIDKLSESAKKRIKELEGRPQLQLAMLKLEEKAAEKVIKSDDEKVGEPRALKDPKLGSIIDDPNHLVQKNDLFTPKSVEQLSNNFQAKFVSKGDIAKRNAEIRKYFDTDVKGILVKIEQVRGLLNKSFKELTESEKNTIQQFVQKIQPDLELTSKNYSDMKEQLEYITTFIGRNMQVESNLAVFSRENVDRQNSGFVPNNSFTPKSVEPVIDNAHELILPEEAQNNNESKENAINSVEEIKVAAPVEKSVDDKIKEFLSTQVALKEKIAPLYKKLDDSRGKSLEYKKNVYAALKEAGFNDLLKNIKDLLKTAKSLNAPQWRIDEIQEDATEAENYRVLFDGYTKRFGQK